MSFDNHSKPSDDQRALKLDSFDKSNHLQLHALDLLNDHHLMSSISTTGKHASKVEAAAWGLAGFALVGHDSPAQNRAAIEHGNDVAARVQSTTVATEGDVAAAMAAYGNIHGNLLTNPEGSFAQSNLAGAIQTAQNKLDLQRAALTNGSGDNANTIQSQFRTPAEYQAHIQRLAELKNQNGEGDRRAVAMNSSETFTKKVVSTVGNSTQDIVFGAASYAEIYGAGYKETKTSIAA